jgi:redox-sensitive bicupin YhaK (pirin superfamily)
MIALRRADARGHFDFGWLETFHTFSFGEYYDPNQMGFRAAVSAQASLRLIGIEPAEVLVFDLA